MAIPEVSVSLNHSLKKQDWRTKWILPYDNSLIVSPASHPREGWDEAFKEMGDRDDDFLINGDQVTWSDWDKDDWEW